MVDVLGGQCLKHLVDCHSQGLLSFSRKSEKTIYHIITFMGVFEHEITSYNSTKDYFNTIDGFWDIWVKKLAIMNKFLGQVGL